MKRIDVLWLVEHIAREMDVAAAVKSLMQTRYGIEITIRNIYLHANDVMKEYVPSIVVLPFLYRISDAAINDYIEVWPAATYFNLAWEQIHYGAHLKMKAPGDDFTRRRVIHHAWGEFYKNYLTENGVPPEHIFLNGNPVYQLYKQPYKHYFTQRKELAYKYNLDPSKKWVFIPENYKWAFFSDEKIQRSAERGGNLDEYLNMREFCRESLTHLLRWCNEAGKNDELEIIFRPRPATNSQQMNAFFKEHIGNSAKGLHFTKTETVREWILASDVVISSYSTSLIEAAIAGKPIFMVEPIPIPESLYCNWYELVSRIYNYSEFEQACLTPTEGNHYELQKWAQDTMLSKGDPIEGVTDFIASLVKNANLSVRNRMYDTASNFIFTSLAVKAKWRIKRLKSYLGMSIHAFLSAIKTAVIYFTGFLCLKNAEQKHPRQVLLQIREKLNRTLSLFSEGFSNTNYFNPITHEEDTFTQTDIDKWVDEWRRILTNG